MLSQKTQESLLERGFSRRQISKIAMGAAAAIPFFNEFALAQQAEETPAAPARRGGRGGGGGGGGMRAYDPEVVNISQNENPMGPTKEGIEAMAKVAPLAWRYAPQGENLEFNNLLQTTENVKQGYVNGYPGSSIPLANAVAAFTSPTRSWTMGSPGYGSGAGRFIGNKVVHVPLRAEPTRTMWKR